MHVAVRVATRPAIDALAAAFARQGEPESVHERRWRAQEAGEGRYLIAWSDEQPIGWVLLRWHASEHASGQHIAELEGLDVVPAYQGVGAGRMLLEAALEAARAEGFVGVGLKVTVANPWNEVARGLYERTGFLDSGAGEFEDGYWYWAADGTKHWDGEPHRYLIKRFA